ncbi:unnamed protein product [Calicophoron daubneyi]|uniref:Arrestin C-terminal-like domain-containing protein n=1 Tax=Calicophoron daubneyi TaxID=300641 RepID=A0AAV2T7Y6_CALDB
MGCDLSKIYNIEIHLENELAVFEPRDEVAGHVVIQAEEDTAVHSCALWLYGMVKTRWKSSPKEQFGRVGSMTGGMNSLRSASSLINYKQSDQLCSATTTLLADVIDNLCITGNGIIHGLCGNQPNKSCYECPWSFMPQVQQKSWSLSSCPPADETKNGEVKTNTWASTDRSPAIHPEEKMGSSNSGSINLPLKPDLRDFRAKDVHWTVCENCDKCLPRVCKEKWGNLVERDAEKTAVCGDARVIYKAKIDLLKSYTEQDDQAAISETGTGDRSGSEDSFLMGSRDQDNVSPQQHLAEQNITSEGVDDGDDGAGASDSASVPSVTSPSGKDEREPKPSGKSESAIILTRGVHVFDFEFQLPSDLPSSFELPTSCLAGGASARLHYGLRVEVCNHTAHIRHTQEREIVVFRPLELIHFPRLRDRVTLHKEFNLSGCCTGPNGYIQCDLSVNKTGFVPGESVTPQVHVTNLSSRPIQTVHLTFAQTVLLRGINGQSHIEVLRLFATRLKPQHTVPDNSFPSRSYSHDDDPSLFSPSISLSSYTSEKAHSAHMVKAKGREQKMHKVSSSKTINTVDTIAVAANGGSAYFEDIIHVPPLPATGLFGRQNLVYIEYVLILRLRMQGDTEGKFDQQMQIPITVGSDPTRETSFAGCSEVVPCYASFNYASGEVVEYDPSAMQLEQPDRYQFTPVYRYFKPRPARISEPVSDSTERGLTKSSSSYGQMRPNLPAPSNLSSTNSFSKFRSTAQKTPQEKLISAKIRPFGSSVLMPQSLGKDQQAYSSVVSNYHVDTSEDQIESASDQLDEEIRVNQLDWKDQCHEASTVTDSDDLVENPKTECSSSSESPQILVLSNKQFFDDGVQVTVGSEERCKQQNGESDSVRVSRPLLPYANIQNTVKQCGRSGNISAQRQFSFEIDSEQNFSDYESQNFTKLKTHESAGRESTLRLGSPSDSDNCAQYQENDSDSDRTSSNQTISPLKQTTSARPAYRHLHSHSSTFTGEEHKNSSLPTPQSTFEDFSINSNESQTQVHSDQTKSAALLSQTLRGMGERRRAVSQGRLVSRHIVSRSQYAMRNLHNRYWSRPLVAALPGRTDELDGIWQTGHVSALK